VAVLQYAYGPNGKTLQQQNATQTDALGEFRLFDLAPGKYYLRAKPMSAQLPGLDPLADSYSTVYYPNAAEQTAAAPIAVAAGQELKGTDFVLHLTATAFIRGHVVKPAGATNCLALLEGSDQGLVANGDDDAFDTVLMVTTSGPLPPSLSASEFQFPGSHKTDNDGNFEFRRIPVGSHTVSANCGVGKQRYTAKLPIQLEAPGLEGLELRPVGPSTIAGTVSVEGESKSKLTDARVWLAERGMDTIFGGTAPDAVPDGAVGEDGAFTFRDVPPNVYHINVEPPPDLFVKSVTAGGHDVRESGVDLTAGAGSATLQVLLSANGGSIEGSVENGEGAKITLIPDDPQLARTAASTMAGPDGHFSFPSLSPGRYTLFAWEGVDVNQALYDADFRKPFESSGQTIDVAEKQKATVQLKLIQK